VANVLYVIDGLSRSGAEQSLVALAPALSARGVHLHVATLSDRDALRGDLETNGIGVTSLRGPGYHTANVMRLRRLIRTRRPDLVHTTLFDADIAGRTAAWLTRTPVVSSLVNVHYGPEQLANPRLTPWKVRGAQALDAASARACVRFHAISGHVRDVMSSRLRIPAQRIDVITRGRDETALGDRTAARSTRARATLDLGDDVPIILAAARQEFQKGLDVLIEALPQIASTESRVRLVIAGREGDATRAILRRIDELGIGRHVRLLGERSDVADLMAAADVFVLPSRWEGLGGVVLEAMALGAPIVSTELPPVRELAGDPPAISFVPVDDPVSLAESVTSLLKDPERAAAQASRARERFLTTYTIERVADGMAAFYGRALEGIR
jgi:glycosyltransferase involved in cell wall biosynthesis